MLIHNMKFKRTVVNRLKKEKIANVCQELKLSPSTVHGWIKQVAKDDASLKEQKQKEKEMRTNSIVKTKGQEIKKVTRKKRKHPTRQVQLQVLAEVQNGMAVEQASSKFNIGRSTIHRWVSKLGLTTGQVGALTTTVASAKPLVVRLKQKEESTDELKRKLMIVLRQRDFYKKQMERLMQDSLQALEML